MEYIEAPRYPADLKRPFAELPLSGDDRAALIVHRSFAPRAAAALTDAAPMYLVLDVPDGSDEKPVEGAVDYETALAEATASRPHSEGRSSDDLYLIYTGGTTGMPKGVVWRHEDIFKSAMGGGDLTQGGDHVSGPAELAERLPDNGITALAAPPLMHAAAHWLTFHQLFTGGKVAITPKTMAGYFQLALDWTNSGAATSASPQA